MFSPALACTYTCTVVARVRYLGHNANWRDIIITRLQPCRWVIYASAHAFPNHILFEVLHSSWCHFCHLPRIEAWQALSHVHPIETSGPASVEASVAASVCCVNGFCRLSNTPPANTASETVSATASATVSEPASGTASVEASVAASEHLRKIFFLLGGASSAPGPGPAFNRCENPNSKLCLGNFL